MRSITYAMRHFLYNYTLLEKRLNLILASWEGGDIVDGHELKSNPQHNFQSRPSIQNFVEIRSVVLEAIYTDREMDKSSTFCVKCQEGHVTCCLAKHFTRIHILMGEPG
jgi:hypothetical protein